MTRDDEERSPKKAKKRTAKKGGTKTSEPKKKTKPAKARRARRRASRPPREDDRIEARDDTEEATGDDALAELGIGSRIVPPLVVDEPPVSSAASSAREPAAEAPSEPEDTAADVEAQIRALEARLDGMLKKSTETNEAPRPTLGEQVGSVAREVVDRIAATAVERPGVGDGTMVDTARELVSSDYYLRQWGRIGMRHRSEEVDDFGLDPTYEARLRPFAEFLYEKYFRTRTRGVENLPETGRCVVVANHSGTLPLDGLMLRTAVRLEHPAARELRWLAEDFVYYLPFLGSFMNRVGAVRACQENAERLLTKHSALVAVFPEGVKGIGKLYRDRYRLQRFGRGGFIRLCLRTQTPLVPCAIVGAEEASPLLHRAELLGKALGLPYVPFTPTFPWLGPAGLLPAPTRWSIAFGEMVRFDGYGPEAADDHVLVGRLAEQIRTTIQGMLDRGVRERQSVWFG